jgi:hypothetical protein
MPNFHKFIQKRIYRPFYIHIPSNSDKDAVLLSGVPRGGTTWFLELLNYDNHYRNIFEPFHPHRCQAAREIAHHPYLSPGAHDPTVEALVEQVVSGKIRESWTDRHNRRLFSTQRLIKGIHTNLMLGWLRQQRPELPIILLNRHPVSVALSWEKLGWLRNADGHRVADMLTGQPSLLHDWPLVGQAAGAANLDDPFEHAVFVWAVLTYVPRQQLEPDEALVVSYESALKNTAETAQRVFSYLGRSFDAEKLLTRARRPSRTTGKHRDRKRFSNQELLQEWQTRATDKQITLARDMIRFFGLDELYPF